MKGNSHRNGRGLSSSGKNEKNRTIVPISRKKKMMKKRDGNGKKVLKPEEKKKTEAEGRNLSIQKKDERAEISFKR